MIASAANTGGRHAAGVPATGVPATGVPATGMPVAGYAGRRYQLKETGASHPVRK
ncbi:hypothetical protein [Paraburkholderia fungorum]|uniref:Uncharacterized protein n=1 Tax=Paraburkholderia fungorum TaxID=134537 RepID=A0AAW3UVM4_9BURK|nr:hypothetical protein [Paraburkholderia fungorum]MBB4514756.1 hypothetical protein [Paraburkholderia fungorum]MBB6202700.1 hypothetical protein [Paraburkholderia fungorum]